MRTVSFSDWYPATVPILIGAGMLGFWVAAIVTHRVPEIESGGIEIRFRIAAETVTGLVLIACGLAALIDPSDGWAIVLSAVGLGMLMSTLVVPPGYYAERREWPLVWMFTVIWALTIPLVIFRLPGS